MREMLSPELPKEKDNRNSPHNPRKHWSLLGNPTSTSRIDSEDQFEKLSQNINTKIREGLTTTLTQFESRLEAALDSLRQTVENSLSGRSQLVTEPESEADHGNCSTSASRMPNTTTNNYNQDNELDLDPLGAGPSNRVTEHTQVSQYTPLREQELVNYHMVTWECDARGTTSSLIIQTWAILIR